MKTTIIVQVDFTCSAARVDEVEVISDSFKGAVVDTFEVSTSKVFVETVEGIEVDKFVLVGIEDGMFDGYMLVMVQPRISRRTFREKA